MYLGIDFGTSGARACVMAPGGEIEEIARLEFGNLAPDEAAATWCEALFSLIAQIPIGLRRRLQALAIDGTSATVLACDEALNTTYPPLRYNDARAVAEAEAIRRAAGREHPAAMATSGLAKVLWLKKHLGLRRTRLYLNQADWLSALLSGRPVSDYHNAMKMGLDLETGQWPAWVAFLADVDTLPVPVKPGTALALVERPRARELGINSDCLVRAGTTDSIAAFLAACQTLVVDSEKPPQRGQFFPDLPAHSRTMGQRSRCRFSDITNQAYPLRVQKAGEKWTAAVASQPTIPKPDRLLVKQQVDVTLDVGIVPVDIGIGINKRGVRGRRYIQLLCLCLGERVNGRVGNALGVQQQHQCFDRVLEVQRRAQVQNLIDRSNRVARAGAG